MKVYGYCFLKGNKAKTVIQVCGPFRTEVQILVVIKGSKENAITGKTVVIYFILGDIPVVSLSLLTRSGESTVLEGSVLG